MATTTRSAGLPDWGQLTSPGWYDEARAPATYRQQTSPWRSYNAAGGIGATALNRGGSLSDAPAFGSLAQMLYNQGRIDPRVMGQQLQATNQGTQAAQTAAAGSLAGRGWGNLGLGKALQASIQQGGENRKAGIRYQDAADSYARQQGNLGLYQQLVGDPRLRYGALGQDMTQFKITDNANREAARMALVCQVVGSLAGGAAKGGG